MWVAPGPVRKPGTARPEGGQARRVASRVVTDQGLTAPRAVPRRGHDRSPPTDQPPCRPTADTAPAALRAPAGARARRVIRAAAYPPRGFALDRPAQAPPTRAAIRPAPRDPRGAG